jgi:hypothetical protein
VATAAGFPARALTHRLYLKGPPRVHVREVSVDADAEDGDEPANGGKDASRVKMVGGEEEAVTDAMVVLVCQVSSQVERIIKYKLYLQNMIMY